MKKPKKKNRIHFCPDCGADDYEFRKSRGKKWRCRRCDLLVQIVVIEDDGQ